MNTHMSRNKASISSLLCIQRSIYVELETERNLLTLGIQFLKPIENGLESDHIINSEVDVIMPNESNLLK